MINVVFIGMLFAVGLWAGLRFGTRRAAGPLVVTVLAGLLAAATALARWVAAIDPNRDTGIVPLPTPSSTVLPALAVALSLTFLSTLRGFISLAFRDFGAPGRRPLIRLLGYVVVSGSIVSLLPWVFGVTFDTPANERSQLSAAVQS